MKCPVSCFCDEYGWSLISQDVDRVLSFDLVGADVFEGRSSKEG